MVDEATQMKFVDFFATKNGMVEPTCEKLHMWAQHQHKVDVIRMDNAGENQLLEQRCQSKDWKLGIKFEKTSRKTPQQNHLAEVGLATLANRARALMIRANLPHKLKFRLFREAYKTVALMDGFTVITINNVTATRFIHWCTRNPKFTHSLRTWGEAGTVTIKSNNMPKLANRGVQCVFVGYALDHSGDTYRMWDPDTSGVHVTRDIIWLRRMFYQPEATLTLPSAPLTPPTLQAPEGENEIEDAVEDPEPNEQDASLAESDGEEDDDNENKNAIPVTTRTGRVINPPRRLIEEIGNTAIQDFTSNYYERLVEFGLVGAGIGGGFHNTQELHVLKFNEAMQSKDKEHWKNSVDEEHQRFVQHKAFQQVKKKDLPPKAKILSSTWAMKKKSNGKYRARLNARGFEQVDGVHYDEDTKSSPVVSDPTILIVLVLMLLAGWSGHIVDVNGAFLNGRFEPQHRIYMDVPRGFEKFYPNDVVLLLLRTIYGTKQAALQFWRALIQAIKRMYYKRSDADPCLFFKRNPKGELSIWIAYIDDLLTVGKPDVVHKAKIEMMKQFDCEDVGPLQEYIGCKLEIDKEKRRAKITQPVLLQSLSDEFDLPTNQVLIPATAGTILRYKNEDANFLTAIKQRKFRSGVGKLLHLAKWSRPEIKNSVRELTRGMAQGTEESYTSMERVMNYCVQTPNRGLVLAPTGTWTGKEDEELIIKGLSNTTYASDHDTRRSVMGRTTFVNDAPVIMKSNMRRYTDLSVTESELGGATETAQDMMFVLRVLESMDLKVKKPMMLYVDNKGAKDLANNWSVGGRTRHIEVRQNYLRELKEQGLILCVWIAGSDMCSDLFTKNLPRQVFEKHSRIYVGQDEYMEDFLDIGIIQLPEGARRVPTPTWYLE